jgi:hypothetical protein
MFTPKRGDGGYNSDIPPGGKSGDNYNPLKRVIRDFAVEGSHHNAAADAAADAPPIRPGAKRLRGGVDPYGSISFPTGFAGQSGASSQGQGSSSSLLARLSPPKPPSLLERMSSSPADAELEGSSGDASSDGESPHQEEYESNSFSLSLLARLSWLVIANMIYEHQSSAIYEHQSSANR